MKEGCDLTQSYVWHDSLRYVAWLVDMCDMTHWYVWRESYHTLMSHITYTNDSWSCHTYQWVMSDTSMSHVTHINESCHTHEWVMSHKSMSHVVPREEQIGDHTATHCNTLQHTTKHCNILQHTATHCNTLENAVQGRCVAVCCSLEIGDCLKIPGC